MLGGEKNLRKCQNPACRSFCFKGPLVPSLPSRLQPDQSLVRRLSWRIPFQLGSAWGAGGRQPGASGQVAPFPGDQGPQCCRVLKGSDGGPSKASSGILKDLEWEERRNNLFERKKLRSASHWKVPAGTPLWALGKNQELSSGSTLRTSGGNQHGPSESPG